MNHPQREEWMPYLFGEAKRETRQHLDQHLLSCPECRTELQRWQRTLEHLDAWRVPSPARAPEAFAPPLRWAAAAGVLLVLGLAFLLGRFASGPRDPASLRASITAQIRQELRAEFAQVAREQTAGIAAATLAASTEQTKRWLAEYARTVDARLEAERTDRIADCLSLKKDVDTIAVNADAGLRHTEQTLVHLAHYSQPDALYEPSNQAPIHN